MKQSEEFRKLFLTNTDDTGRFTVTSFRTGRTYFVEPIGYTRTAFGDVNPATKKVEGSYGEKYRGSIEASESLIVKENGFDEIYETGVGCSPYSKIWEIDAQYPDKA